MCYGMKIRHHELLFVQWKMFCVGHDNKLFVSLRETLEIIYKNV